MTAARPVCAIVGAGEGLGRALAARFAREGCDLALVSRTEAGSRAAAEAAEAAGARVDRRSADATAPETVERALAELAAETGPADVLIYNVRGSFAPHDPLEMTYDQLDAVFRLEVAGAYAAARAVIPAMRERGAGTVLFSSATAAYRGSARHALYAIGKFGLRALAQSLAKAYGPGGVHVVHVRLDCDLDVPVMRDAYGEDAAARGLADPDAVAEAYWQAHRQPRAAWSNEIELRPSTEGWTI